MNKENEFIKGYCCAIAVLIKDHGCRREALDLIKGLGKQDQTSLRKIGVAPEDIELFLEHKLI